MKKKNIVLLIIGLLLIGISFLIAFSNSNKKVDLNSPKEKIENLKKEIEELVITEKIENLKTYQIKISEIAIIILIATVVIITNHGNVFNSILFDCLFNCCKNFYHNTEI